MAFIRRFYFFDLLNVAQQNDSEHILKYLSNVSITTCAPGRNSIWFGDDCGNIHNVQRIRPSTSGHTMHENLSKNDFSSSVEGTQMFPVQNGALIGHMKYIKLAQLSGSVGGGVNSTGASNYTGASSANARAGGHLGDDVLVILVTNDVQHCVYVWKVSNNLGGEVGRAKGAGEISKMKAAFSSAAAKSKGKTSGAEIVGDSTASPSLVVAGSAVLYDMTPIPIETDLVPPTTRVTCFDVLETGPGAAALSAHNSLRFAALGLADGSMLLMSGDLIRARRMKFRRIELFSESPAAPIVLENRLNENACAVTNIKLTLEKQTSAKTNVAISTTTTAIRGGRLLAYATNRSSLRCAMFSSQSGVYESMNTLEDAFGCDSGCGIFSDPDNSFIMAHKNALFFYSNETGGRGRCFVLEVDQIQHLQQLFNTNLLMVCNQAGPTSSSGEPSSSQLLDRKNPIVIFDYQNNFIAGEFTLSNVSHVVCEWNSALILSSTASPTSNSSSSLSSSSPPAIVANAFSLTEKDTQSKLSLLFSKRNYSFAIEIAKSKMFNSNDLADIFRRYADHLYKQKQYDQAIQEYIKTIGNLEPSYVIEKFLDTPRIHNLAAYLEELHRTGHATQDHITLLLNCYTKLKDEPKLDQFIDNISQGFYSDSKVNAAALGTAVRLLRQANFYVQAARLSERCGRIDWQVCILVENLEDYETALSQIESRMQGGAEAMQALANHGKQLMSANPNRTAQLLHQICSQSNDCNDMKENEMNVNYFLKVFVNDRRGLMEFLEKYVGKMAAQSSSSVPRAFANTLLELMLYEWSTATQAAAAAATTTSFTSSSSSPADKSSKSQSQTPTQNPFKSELEQRDEKEQHLYKEKADWEKRAERERERGRHTTGDARKQRELQIMRFLEDTNSNYDPIKAKMWCQQRDFLPGFVFLSALDGHYDQILDCYMKLKDEQMILETCRKYGSLNENLWMKALEYFSKLPEKTEEIREIVQRISEEEQKGERVGQRSATPLMVIQKLSSSDSLVCLSVVRDYLIDQMQSAVDKINAEKKAIGQILSETEKNRKDVNDMTKNVKVFQMRKCVHCKAAVEPPCVHFLCSHTFHADCLKRATANENKCPQCSSNNNRLLMEIDQWEQNEKQQHEKQFGGGAATGQSGAGATSGGPSEQYRVGSSGSLLNQLWRQLQQSSVTAAPSSATSANQSAMPEPGRIIANHIASGLFNQTESLHSQHQPPPSNQHSAVQSHTKNATAASGLSTNSRGGDTTSFDVPINTTAAVKKKPPIGDGLSVGTPTGSNRGSARISKNNKRDVDEVGVAAPSDILPAPFAGSSSRPPPINSGGSGGGGGGKNKNPFEF